MSAVGILLVRQPRTAIDEGLAQPLSDAGFASLIDEAIWHPVYPRRVDGRAKVLTYASLGEKSPVSANGSSRSTGLLIAT